MHDPPPARGRMASLALTIALITTGLPVRAKSARAECFRDINVNRPPVVVDGNQGQEGDTNHVASRDQTREELAVPPGDGPVAEPERPRPRDPAGAAAFDAEIAPILRDTAWSATVDCSRKGNSP